MTQHPASVMYERLAQPGRIGPMRLRNRVVMAPMGTNYSTTDGLSTERDKQYYAERARRLMQAGYDGVEVHGGNGYLFQQFFTPRINKRTDRYTIVEALSTVALGMARNNRIELIERIESRGARIMTSASVLNAEGSHLELDGADGATTKLEIGDFLIIAIGPAPEQEASHLCEAAGVPYAVVGDANKPGDFLSCLRDASMVALSVDHRFRETKAEAETADECR